MTFPQMQDNPDEAIALLRQIAANTGTVEDDDDDPPTAPEVRPIRPGTYRVVETDALESDAVNDDGTITLKPGETLDLARFSEQVPGRLLAVGATDAADVRYFVETDNQRKPGGVTNSPLGLLNDPFSFVQNYGAFIPFVNSVAYRARLPQNASSSVDLAARLHVEVIR